MKTAIETKELEVPPANLKSALSWYIEDTEGDAGGFTWFKG